MVCSFVGTHVHCLYVRTYFPTTLENAWVARYLRHVKHVTCTSQMETAFPMEIELSSNGNGNCLSNDMLLYFQERQFPNTYIVCVLCVDVGCTLMACMRVWYGQSESYKGAAISGCSWFDCHYWNRQVFSIDCTVGVTGWFWLMNHFTLLSVKCCTELVTDHGLLTRAKTTEPRLEVVQFTLWPRCIPFQYFPSWDQLDIVQSWCGDSLDLRRLADVKAQCTTEIDWALGCRQLAL